MVLTQYRREIEKASMTHRLDAHVLEALIIIESSGKAHAYRYEPDFWRRYLARNPLYVGKNPERVSSSYGLCQVMYPTAIEHDFPFPEPEYLFVPEINLEMGCRVLGGMLEWADGDLMKALAAYNGGKGNWLGAAPQAYAKKVAAMLERVREART